MSDFKEVTTSDYRDNKADRKEFDRDTVNLIRSHFSADERIIKKSPAETLVIIATSNRDGSYNVHIPTSTLEYSGAIIVRKVDLFRALEEQYLPRLMSVILPDQDKDNWVKEEEKRSEFTGIIRSLGDFKEDIVCRIKAEGENFILDNMVDSELGSTWRLYKNVAAEPKKDEMLKKINRKVA